MKKLSLVLAPLLAVSVFAPLAQADTNCVGTECELVFQYTGDVQTWNPPTGIDEFEFELIGASGGGNYPGKAAKVTGTVTNLPEVVLIRIGGAGTKGSQAVGGYNGGGEAGGVSTLEGSGGGASDISFGPQLTDRIVVAGGGGGSGGWFGGAGGSGGEIAGNGVSGQGGGGTGGTDSAGGMAGTDNGGSGAGDGGFGFGGVGGTSNGSGGGGGGGGWYGGGGGGSDNNSCCTDAGGGGAGSSYANPSFSQNLEITTATSTGNGSLVIRYQNPITVASNTFSPVEQTNMTANLVFNMQVSDLDATDIEAMGCDLMSVSGSGDSYQLGFENCQEGQIGYRLAANSVVNGGTGPDNDFVASFVYDISPPELVFSEIPSPSNNSSQVLTISVSESYTLQTQPSVTGCSEQIVETNPGAITVSVSDCAEGENSIVIAAGSIVDQHGNAAPPTDVEIGFLADFTAPVVTKTDAVATQQGTDADSYISVVAGFSITEVSFDVDQVVFSGTAGCELNVVADQFAATLTANRCSPGAIAWLIPADSFSDAAGNLAPETNLFTLASVPEVVIEQPVAELPEELPDEQPTTEEPGSEEPTAEQPATEQPQEQSPIVPIDPGPSAPNPADTSGPDTLEPDDSDPEPVVEEPAVEEPITDEPVVAAPESGANSDSMEDISGNQAGTVDSDSESQNIAATQQPMTNDADSELLTGSEGNSTVTDGSEADQQPVIEPEQLAQAADPVIATEQIPTSEPQAWGAREMLPWVFAAVVLGVLVVSGIRLAKNYRS